MAMTRSRSPPRLPSYGSRTSSTASPRLERLWIQRSTSPMPWGGVQTLVKTLVQLPLNVQSQFLLLRALLQARLAHHMRTVPREALAAHMRRTDAAVLVWRRRLCSTCLMGWVCSTLGRHMTLPLLGGCLGLHMQSNEVPDAVVAGAGHAERNFKGCQAALCPLQGVSGDASHLTNDARQWGHGAQGSARQTQRTCHCQLSCGRPGWRSGRPWRAFRTSYRVW